MNDDIIIYDLDQRSIARILNTFERDDIQCDNARDRTYDITCVPKCIKNSIMDNIHWKIGSEPMMNLCGMIETVDVIAESILELPLLSKECLYYVAELCEGGSRQFLGMFAYDSGPILSRISCYMFIDWLNSCDNVFAGRTVRAMSIVQYSTDAAHFRIEFEDT